jgi:hypothetical protein
MSSSCTVIIVQYILSANDTSTAKHWKQNKNEKGKGFYSRTKRRRFGLLGVSGLGVCGALLMDG